MATGRFFFKFDESKNPQMQRSSMGTKHKRHWENHTKGHHDQVLRLTSKDQDLKGPRRKKMGYLQRTKDKGGSRFLLEAMKVKKDGMTE